MAFPGHAGRGREDDRRRSQRLRMDRRMCWRIALAVVELGVVANASSGHRFCVKTSKLKHDVGTGIGSIPCIAVGGVVVGHTHGKQHILEWIDTAAGVWMRHLCRKIGHSRRIKGEFLHLNDVVFRCPCSEWKDGARARSSRMNSSSSTSDGHVSSNADHATPLVDACLIFPDTGRRTVADRYGVLG